MEKKYFVNYNTGAGNFKMMAELDEVIKEAVNNIAYTQQDICITDDNDNIIAVLPWINRPSSDEDIITADYGNFGFYAGWELYE
jgi:hypothetical protein